MFSDETAAMLQLDPSNNLLFVTSGTPGYGSEYTSAVAYTPSVYVSERLLCVARSTLVRSMGNMEHRLVDRGCIVAEFS